MRKRKQDRDGLYDRPDSPYYWASYCDAGGTRIRRSTGIQRTAEGHREAEALLAKWRLEAHREKQWEEQPSRTFDEMMVAYLKATRRIKRAPDRDVCSAKQLYPFFSGMELGAMTGPIISQYIRKRRETVAPGTINKEIGLLSSAFNWARKELGWDIVNPVAGRRLNEGQGRLRWLTRAEAAALLRAAEDQRRARHLADFIRLSLHTGMRKGEVLGLEWRRVDLSQGLIYLEAEHQKNGRFGSVPLNEESRAALVSRVRFRSVHCPQSEWVFCRWDGTRIRDIKSSFVEACKAAGIKDFRPHDLRHTFAAWLVQAGVPIREVAELLCHADIRMTMRYAHLAPENVRAAVARLAPAWSRFGHIATAFPDR